jgi:hypothetical protein
MNQLRGKKGKLTVYDTGIYRYLHINQSIEYFEIIDGRVSLIRFISTNGDIVCGYGYKGIEYFQGRGTIWERRIRYGGLWKRIS